MNSIGMIIREDINQYFVENVKTKVIETVQKLPNSNYKVTEYISYSIDKNTIHKTYKYNSLPATSIITEIDIIDGNIAISTSFHIVGCLSKKEAELGFNEFFQKSSCNFVKNLKYIENENDGHYDVTGEIGLYYNERFTSQDFVDKFNSKFNTDIETVRQNLEKELSVINTEKEIIKVSNNLFLITVGLLVVVMTLGIFFKH